MNVINKEITVAIVKRKLMGESSDKKHPRLIIEIISGNVFNSIHIQEVFSSKIKDRLREMIEKNEPVPVDRLLGKYDHKERKITIYSRAIELFSREYDFDKDRVEHIVRLHEYAHAIFHLGCNSINPIADIDAFVDERNKIFNGVSESAHEWIAQSVCYSALCQGNSKGEIETFKKMMLHQPDIYKIDTQEVENAINAVGSEKDPCAYFWGCVLDARRAGHLSDQDLSA